MIQCRHSASTVLIANHLRTETVNSQAVKSRGPPPASYRSQLDNDLFERVFRVPNRY
jgi:hypothetical protein